MMPYSLYRIEYSDGGTLAYKVTHTADLNQLKKWVLDKGMFINKITKLTVTEITNIDPEVLISILG